MINAQPAAGSLGRARIWNLQAPVFYYDLSSPYSYLAASRVDDLLAVRAQWRPIAFGVIVRRLGKTPWSFASDRSAHFNEISRRAEERGLPPVRYPEGWPVETYSLIALRAAVLADGQDQLRELSRELYHTAFVEGQNLAEREIVLEAVQRAGMDREAVDQRLDHPETKQRLRSNTDQALNMGVSGVPTIAVGERLFWGDDRIEDAAIALAG